MDIDGQEAMRLSWKAPQERHCSAVSTATFFVAWHGFFPKCGEMFSCLSKAIMMPVDQSSPIFSKKAKFCWHAERKSHWCKNLLSPKQQMLLLGLHVLGLSFHFAANALHLYIFPSPGSPASSLLCSTPFLPHHHHWWRPNTLHYVQPHDTQI